MTGRSRKFSTKDVVYPALMCALLIAGQYVFSFIAGVEIVTALLLCFSAAFGVKRGVLCAVAFSLLRCMVFGFFPNVVLLYLIYYPLFATVFGLLGKLKKDVFVHCPVWLVVLVNVLLIGLAAACACAACFNLIHVSRLLLGSLRTFLWVIFALCTGLCAAFDGLLIAGRITRKNLGAPLRVLVFTGLAAAFTVCFTLLDDLITPLFYGYTGDAALAYFYASFSAMLPQVVCAAVTVSVLFLPLTGTLERLNNEKALETESGVCYNLVMKNFLFDLYGTLIDIHTDEESPAFWAKIADMIEGEVSGETLRAAYCKLCREAKEGLSELQEFDLLAVFTRLLKQFPPREKQSAGEFAYAFRRASVCRCRPFAGAKEILTSLRARGARVYLLSNAQACFTRAELDEAGLSELFDGIMISSEVGWKKPAPQFFEAAFARFGLGKADSMYVGNDLHDDVGGAHGAGLQCAYIQTPQSGSYPNPPEPDFVATDHENLCELLLSLI